MSFRELIAVGSRPVRRRVTPWQFKEAYANAVLRGRPHSLYVEIGVRGGESMRHVDAHEKIGIDPARSAAMRALQPGELFFEMTSDEFFASEAPGLFAERRIDVALVDGLHEFRQALRDVLSLEPYMAADGLIVVDDCNPPTAQRAVDVPTGGTWNGDVWKVAEYMRQERQDLRYRTADADQGVGLLTGFGATAPPQPDDEIVARYKALPYGYLAGNRVQVLQLVAAGEAALR